MLCAAEHFDKKKAEERAAGRKRKANALDQLRQSRAAKAARIAAPNAANKSPSSSPPLPTPSSSHSTTTSPPSAPANTAAPKMDGYRIPKRGRSARSPSPRRDRDRDFTRRLRSPSPLPSRRRRDYDDEPRSTMRPRPRQYSERPPAYASSRRHRSSVPQVSSSSRRRRSPTPPVPFSSSSPRYGRHSRGSYVDSDDEEAERRRRARRDGMPLERTRINSRNRDSAAHRDFTPVRGPLSFDDFTTRVASTSPSDSRGRAEQRVRSSQQQQRDEHDRGTNGSAVAPYELPNIESGVPQTRSRPKEQRVFQGEVVPEHLAHWSDEKLERLFVGMAKARQVADRITEESREKGLLNSQQD